MELPCQCLLSPSQLSRLSRRHGMAVKWDDGGDDDDDEEEVEGRQVGWR